MADMADGNSGVFASVTDVDIVSCRWSCWCGFPHDSLASGADEDFVPDSGTGTGELYWHLEQFGENVEGGGMEGIYAWEWD